MYIYIKVYQRRSRGVKSIFWFGVALASSAILFVAMMLALDIVK